MADTHVVHEGAGDSSFGFFMGMILLIAFVFFLLFYGLPAMRNMGAPGNVQQEVTVPDAGNQSPNINVPDKVDVNLNQ